MFIFPGKSLQKPQTPGWLSICPQCRNAHLNLSTTMEFAPNFQLAPRNFGAFVHSMQTIVSLTSISTENRRINSPAVISHLQPEFSLAVSNFDFNFPRLRMAEGIPHCLGGQPVNFISQDRM